MIHSPETSKLPFLFLLLALLLPFPCYGQPKLDVPILFGGDHEFAPFEYLDRQGEPQGFDIDILRAVAEVMNMPVEVRLGPWKEVRRDLERGRIDVLLGMRYSQERDALLDFSVPYLVNTSTIFVRKDSPIRSLNDLQGKEVIVQRGDIMHDYIREANITANLILVADQVEALKLLASGRHDAALCTRLAGLYLIHHLELANLKPTGRELSGGPYGFAVAEGDTLLLQRLNEGLRILKATGRYEQIYRRWFGLYEKRSLWSEMARYAAWILTPILLLLALALVWNWALRRQVAEKTREVSEQLAERQRAEAALEAERAFQKFVESSPVAIAMVDDLGAIRYVNRKFSELFGYTCDEIGDLETWWSLACPDHCDLPTEGDVGAAAPLEVTVCGKGGTRRHVDCRFSSVDGHHIIVFNDITDRKRAEEALAYRVGLEELISDVSARFVNIASEEVDQEIDRALEDIGKRLGADRSYVFRLSEDGRRMSNTHEWCAPSIESQTFRLQDLPCESLPWFMKQLSGQGVFYCPSVAALGPEAGSEKEAWQAEGIQSLITVPMMLKGRMVGIVGFDSVRSEKSWPEVPFLLRTVGEIFANVLDRRRVENELRAAHQQLQDIIDFLPDATFVIDREGNVVAWNRAIEEMTGVLKKDMIGQGDYAYAVPFFGERCPLLIDLVDRPEKISESRYRKIGRQGQALFAERYHPSLNSGKGAHLWAMASRLYDQEGNVVGAIESMRNISDHIEARERLEAANREMEAFVYTVSHDLRTPLTPIIGYADYLREVYGDRLDESARNYLAQISASGNKMMELLEDLLNLATIGKLEAPKEPVDSEAVVRQVVGNLAMAISEANMSVAIGDLPRLRVPETILSQIFANLVGNAVRYAGPAGGPIEVGGERRGDAVCFYVRDHGPGIPATERERIFEAFYRDSTQKTAGTGIGLAVVQKCARLYGGGVRVETTPGGGATFVVEMSDALAEEEDPSLPSGILDPPER